MRGKAKRQGRRRETKGRRKFPTEGGRNSLQGKKKRSALIMGRGKKGLRKGISRGHCNNAKRKGKNEKSGNLFN